MSIGRSFATTALQAFLVFAVVFGPETTTARGDSWTKYEVEGLTVFSDCPPYRVRSLLRPITAHRAVIRRLFIPEGYRSPSNTLVYFEDDKDLRRYFWPTDQDSRYFRTLFGWRIIGRDQLFATAWDGNIDDRISTMQLRDTDVVLQWQSEDVPRWLRIALMSTVAKPRITDDAVVFRELSSDERSILKKEKWQPWPDIIEEKSLESVDPDDLNKTISLRYAQLHLLGDWIVFGNHDSVLNYWTIVNALRRDHGSKTAAFEAALGRKLEQLDSALREHLRAPTQNRTIPFDSKTCAESVKTTLAQPAEIDVLRYEMLASGKAHSEARAYLDRAESSGADFIALKMARVRRALFENDYTAVMRNCRDAIATGSRDPIAYLLSAEGRMGQLTHSYSPMNHSQTIITQVTGSAGADFETCLEEIRTAIRIDPGFVAAYSTLGRAFFSAPSTTSEQAAELTPGISDHPAGLYIRYLRGAVLSRAGAGAEARTDFDYLTTNFPASVAAKLAREWQAQTKFDSDSREVDRLLIRKQFIEARAIAVSGLQNESVQSRNAGYKSMLAKIEETEAWNEILALFRKNQWSDLDAAAERFQQSFPKSRHLTAVRNMQREAKKNQY